MVSNLDPSTGTLMTTLVHAFTPQMKCVFRAQSRAKADWVGSELTGTYTGSDWVGTLTAANVAPEKKEGTMVLSYLQKVSKNWSFGYVFAAALSYLFIFRLLLPYPSPPPNCHSTEPLLDVFSLHQCRLVATRVKTPPSPKGEMGGGGSSLSTSSIPVMSTQSKPE